MSSPDTSYFRARALEERERAASSDAPNISAIHQELEEKCQTLAQLIEKDGSVLPGARRVDGGCTQNPNLLIGSQVGGEPVAASCNR